MEKPNSNLSEVDIPRLKRTYEILFCFGILLVLAGLCRKLPLAWLRSPIVDVFCLTDLLTVFLFAPIAVSLLLLLFKTCEGSDNRFDTILFIVGVYFLGVGFGMHEPMNRFSVTYSPKIDIETFRNSVRFFDDQLGHWVFFLGFALVSIAGSISELKKPFTSPLLGRKIAPGVVIAIVSGIVIFFNMVRERAGVDIVILLLTAALVAVARFFWGSPSLRRTPLVLFLFIAYGGGSIATLLVWLYSAMGF